VEKEEIQAITARLPTPLHALLTAELAAGNRITGLDHGFPAPPVGCCLMLEQVVTTMAHDTPGLIYREWPNWMGYRGFTDPAGLYFILEPPMEPPPDPVMAYGPDGAAMSSMSSAYSPAPPDERRPEIASPPSLGVFWPDRDMDYEKWHDGIGYDLDALEAMSESERQAVEANMALRGVMDWRDVEALSKLDGAMARKALSEALVNGSFEVRLAIARLRSDWLDPAARTALLEEALGQAAPFAGLSHTVDAVLAFHPPRVMSALWQQLESREGGVAVHYAALLAYLHHIADSPFDMAMRPFFLTFNTEDPLARRSAIGVLRDKIALEGTPEP